MNSTVKVVLGGVFVAAVAWYADSIAIHDTHNGFLVLAVIFGAYMAMNIGAKDVANNVGPAVGAGALTIGGAIVIASIFEVGGALIAGGNVVGTIKKGIIDPAAFGGDPMLFVYAMSAALLAAALWLNLATWLKAPVSTTHAIVGGVLGGGIAAGGFAIVSWGTMGKIVASWVISPVLGGVIAAIFLYIIKSQILYKEDRIRAAKKVVPILVAVMAVAFLTYLTLKGFKHIWKDLVELFGFLPQTKKPTFGAALLSFAHGANDVANAVGPLAAVNDALTHLAVSKKAAIPLWVMVVGGVGISVGLALYGSRLIRTVGSEITELDQMRAFSIMMAAAITVVIASQIGLPVSSTHIAVGAVFGVGFLREWLDSNNMGEKQQQLRMEMDKLDVLKSEMDACTNEDPAKKLALIEAHKAQKKRVKQMRKHLKENYVKRGMVKKIITAWIITVPAAALLSALIFYVLIGVSG